MKLEEQVMKSIPLLAGVPTAWMVFDATANLMHFPLPVALASALTVEGIDFVAIRLAGEMREFNRHLDATELKQKMNAPEKQAYGVVALYVCTASLMTVVLHIAPEAVLYAPLPFIAMAVAGGWLYSLKSEHLDRVQQWQERRLAKKQRRSGKTSDAKSDAQRDPATQEATLSETQRRSAKQNQPASVAKPKIYRCECGQQFTDRYVYSGHAGKCEIHKNNKLIPVSFSKEKVQS